MHIYIAYTYSFYGSTVVSAKATDTFGSLLRRSQKISVVRLEKVTTLSSNQADSHVVLYVVFNLVKLVMRFIFEYISTYRPTFILNSTRESKNLISMA